MTTKNIINNKDTRKRLYIVYAKLHDRVDNPKHKQYKDYGGRGVTIDEYWYSFDKFVQDVPGISGWDEDRFLSHNLELDKDLKVQGNKLYSKETCMWVTHKENMQVQPLRQVPFYAYNEYTGEVKTGINQRQFAIDNHISQSTISSVLNGRKHRSGDWWIWAVGSKPPVPKRYVFTDKLGKVTWDVNPRRLSVRLNKDPRYISGLLSKKIPNGTKLDVVDINLCDLVEKYDKSSTTKFPDTH